MEIVLATRNKKKVEEIRRITSDMDVTILTLEDFPDCPEVTEDGKSFRENAAKKSLAVAKYTGKPSLSDDSGLEVDALGGAPGIFSARFAGETAADSENMDKLLRELSGIRDEDRKARFVCCIALSLPEGKTYTFEETAEGKIINEPRGRNGFGYDPVFLPEGGEKTFAEIGEQEKDAISHRGKAMQALRNFLKANTIR